MKNPPIHYASAAEPGSESSIEEWLNSQPNGDWRIVDYSPERSKLVLQGDVGERQLCIMCLGTWYVKSQVNIPSPSFMMEVGKKKMSSGMLSGSCYDKSIKLAMDDGAHVSEVICDFVAVWEMRQGDAREAITCSTLRAACSPGQDSAT